jgi:hypothetical protein
LAAACKPVPIVGSVDVVSHSIGQQAFDSDADGTWAKTASAPEDLVVNVWMGWTVPDVIGWVEEEVAAGRPERLVVDLGVNDATPYWGGDGWVSADVANFERLIGAPHESACVMVVLPAVTSSALPGLAEQLELARADLSALAETRPNTVVIDYADFIAAHPEHIDEDGVHLLTPSTTPEEDVVLASQGLLAPVSPEAAASYQEFYWAGLAQCPSSPGTATAT